MHIVADNAQFVGARNHQEDSFGFSAFDVEGLIDKRGYLAVVADGMGGMSCGREASGIAVQAFLQHYQDLGIGGSIPHLLRASLLYANERVCRFAGEMGLQNQVGTTLIAAAIKDHHLHWISVGDSRIYLFRNNILTQLTMDHIYGNQLYEEVAKGRLTKEDVEADPQKEALTSFLGLVDLDELDVNVKPFPLEPDDRILLLTDGVFGFLTEEEIVTSLEGNGEHPCTTLIHRVEEKSHPFQDNATAAILQMMGTEISLSRFGVDIETTQRTPPLPMKRKRIMHYVLSFLLFALLGSGGYLGYVHFVKTDTYKEWIPTKWEFLNKDVQSEKEGEH